MDSALVGALQFGVAFVWSEIVASSISTSALPLALGILIPAVIALLLSMVDQPLNVSRANEDKTRKA